MQLFRKRFLAWTAVGALSAASLFAQAAPARHRGPGARRMRVLATVLNLTPDQRTQAKAIFQESNQAVKPVRQQLHQDRAALQSAVKAGDNTQIQKLSASIGNEAGQLAAARATAMSKLYKTLTPDQQQKFDALHQAMHGPMRQN